MEQSTNPHLQTPNNNRITWDVLRDTFLLLRDCGYSLEPAGAVCRRWREVYTNTGVLWTKIRIFSSKTRELTGNLHRLSTLALRSADCSVVVDCRQSETWHEDAVEQSIQQVVSSIPVQRWEALFLGSSDVIRWIKPLVSQMKSLSILRMDRIDEGAHHILGILANKRQKLQALGLDWVPNGPEAQHSMDWDLIGYLIGKDTRLIHRGLIVPTGEFQVCRLTLSATDITRGFGIHLNLKELMLVGGIMHQDLQFDVQFPNLERLDLVYIIRQIGLNEITAPSLKHLEVCFSEFDILGTISAPQIEKLCVRGMEADPYNTNQGIIAAMDMPTYEISPICIVLDFVVEISTLYQLLTLSPRLEHFIGSIYPSAVSHKVDWIQLYRFLAERRSSSLPVAPRWKLCEMLTTFAINLKWFQCIGEREDALGAMRDVLQARSSSSLRELVVTWTDGSTSSIRTQNIDPRTVS